MAKKSEEKFAGFSEEEKAAMKARVAELKAEAKISKNRDEGERALLEVLKLQTGKDRAIGERLHTLIKESAPDLMPKTWYGMPAYANQEGKVVVFFRPASRFKERYLTFGFNQEARLDHGTMWPISYALTEITHDVEKEIVRLVKKALS